MDSYSVEKEKSMLVVERKQRGRPKKSQQPSSGEPAHLGKAHLIHSVYTALNSDPNSVGLRSTTSRIITQPTSQMVTRRHSTKVAAAGPSLHDSSTDKQVKEMDAPVSDSDSCARNVSKGSPDEEFEEWNRITPRLVRNHDRDKLNCNSHHTRTIGSDAFAGKVNFDRKLTCRLSRTRTPQFTWAQKALRGESYPCADPSLQNDLEDITDAAGVANIRPIEYSGASGRDPIGRIQRHGSGGRRRVHGIKRERG